MSSPVNIHILHQFIVISKQSVNIWNWCNYLVPTCHMPRSQSLHRLKRLVLDYLHHITNHTRKFMLQKNVLSILNTQLHRDPIYLIISLLNKLFTMLVRRMLQMLLLISHQRTHLVCLQQLVQLETTNLLISDLLHLVLKIELSSHLIYLAQFLTYHHYLYYPQKISQISTHIFKNMIIEALFLSPPLPLFLWIDPSPNIYYYFPSPTSPTASISTGKNRKSNSNSSKTKITAIN